MTSLVLASIAIYVMMNCYYLTSLRTAASNDVVVFSPALRRISDSLHEGEKYRNNVCEIVTVPRCTSGSVGARSHTGGECCALAEVSSAPAAEGRRHSGSAGGR